MFDILSDKLALIAGLAAAAAAGQLVTAPRGVSVAQQQTPAPLSAAIDGRLWRCAEGACRAQASSAAESQPVLRECRRAVAQLGPLSAYATGARTLTGEELASCNQAARRADRDAVRTAAN